MADILYQCASLQQRFGARLALDVPALTIAAGSVYTLTGPNGSGKTTLLATLAFLSRPAAGQLWFRGEPVSWKHSALLRLRTQATLVHQSPYLFSGTVADNLAIALKHRRVPAQKIRARVAEALERVDLVGYECQDAKRLSGGEAQRVAFARALLLEPRVLLLDEPLANVDRRSASILEAVIARLPSAGATVVMSSHDPEHSARFGSEIIRLRDGRLVAPDDADPAVPNVDRARPGFGWEGGDLPPALATIGGR